MKIHPILLTVLIIHAPLMAKGYRFICNGILADGSEHVDNCGAPCDDAHAPRWPNPNIPVLVDYDKTPYGISKIQWQDVVKKSFAAWENVSGTSLRFVPMEGKSQRAFGSNRGLHEIFWITDRDEWRTVVGVGEFGTLGATLTPYTCDENRQIVDSDMALNGLEYIDWQIDCDSEDCISPQTTLVHELGHFFGLDHPCQQCVDSVMSARAGLDFKYPLFDDMQGLRMLYPDKSSGGFGYPCSSSAECQNNGQCLSVHDNQYCSHECSEDRDCAMGALCVQHNGSLVCAFIDGDTAEAKGEEENCSRLPCKDSLICAGISLEQSYCFNPCNSDLDCFPEQLCVGLENDKTGICMSIKQKGEKCFATQLCDEKLFCIFSDSEVGYCREGCNSSNDESRACPSGEVCQLIDGEKEICLPIGLSLGENSAGFASDNKRAREKARSAYKDSMGCSFNKNPSDFSMIALLLLLLWRSKNLKRSPTA